MIPAALIFLFLLPATVRAQEDNARLVLQKTATSSKSRIHIVKKGESIRSILRSQPGYEPVPRALIRRLNPDIPDLNLIRPGQRIVLPLPGSSETTEPSPVTSGETLPSPVIYRIMEGDSISRILLSEMKLDPAEVLQAYRLVRKLNPEIPDMSRLPAGGTMRLPKAPAHPATPQTTPLQAASAPPVESPAAAVAGKPDSASPVILDSLFGIIRPVIARMRGAVTASGSYFIPLQESTQVTIDCAQIPVVELDDGTTVLLDYGNRLSENLKKLIILTWKNYSFLSSEELRDGFAGLTGIIRNSPNYKIIRTDKSLELTAKPEILFSPDWIITGKAKTGGLIYRQGIFLLERDEPPLPAEARELLEKNGVAVTEITEGRAIVSLETSSAQQQAAPDLRELQGIALAEKLLTTLGETSIRNAEVVVFDQARYGFNLSVMCDLLIRKGEKRFIFHTKKLPEQFIQILKDNSNEVIPIGEKEHGRALVERALQALKIPISFGYFSFRIPENGKRPRLTLSFSALRATTERGSAFLIDFDMPSALLPLFSGRREGLVVRY